MQRVWKYRGRGSSGLGKEQTDAMINMQRELLAAYEQAGRSWLARAKSEVDLWSELAEKLSKTQSLPVGAHQECVAQRVQMAADDGRRLFEETKRFRRGSRDHSPRTVRREAPECKVAQSSPPVCIHAIGTAWENGMEKARISKAQLAEQGSPHEWEKLIRKLRGIGLEDAAQRLELAVSTLPPDERGSSVSADPLSTD